MAIEQLRAANGSPMDERAIRALASCLRGDLIRPGDDEYEDARFAVSATFDRHPAMIVRPSGVADVVTAVNFARDHDLTIAVRSGGHSIPGHSTTEGGMLIDMALMRGLAIDLERGVVRVQPGLTWGEVTDALQEHGLAVPAGDTASVGVGGLTLGGGIGWLVRKLGLTIDSLISADVVTADGRLLRVSADEHPDLFWGLRGGGGNFGIVTSFEFRTHPVGMVLGGALIFDGREARTVLRRYADVAAAAPEELSTITHLMPAPPLPFIPAHLHGKPVVILMLVYAGDIEEGQAVVNELRAIGTPVADLVNPMPYAAIYALTQEGTRRGLHHHVRSTFMRSLDDDVIDTIAEYGEQATSPISILQIRILGGAMGRVDKSATAFRHRDAQVMLTATNVWEGDTGAERHRAWPERFYEAVRSHESGVYVNFLADEGDGRIREAYGDETYDRLVSLKTRYDPSNLFHLNQNIRPRL